MNGKMFDGIMRTLTNVRHASKLMRSLISLRLYTLILGCDYFAKGSFMEVRRGALTAIKG